MADVRQLPGELNFFLTRGDPFNYSFTLDDGTDPLVLPTTGWRAQVRAKPGTDDPIIFEINVNASGAGSGVINISFDGSNTQTIAKKVYWDLELPGVRTFTAGTLNFEGDVSRDE